MAHILVLGPGALGALFAARLADTGHAVTAACRSRTTAKAIEAEGVSATDADSHRVHAIVPALHRAKRLPDVDAVILATKCAAALPALESWLPKLPSDIPVVAIQNGIMGDTLAARLGERLVSCTVAFPATLTGPGQSVQTGPGNLHIGPWPQGDPAEHPATRAIVALLEPVAPVRQEKNMVGVQWTKLLVNSCITSLGALTGQGLGELLQDRRARRAFLAIVEEGYVAGKAEGVHFEPVGGFRPGLFARHLPGRHAVLRELGRKYRRHRSSSLQSLERGQRSEVDFLNGHIVHAARTHGLAAPVNLKVIGLVHDVEEHRVRAATGLLTRLPV